MRRFHPGPRNRVATKLLIIMFVAYIAVEETASFPNVASKYERSTTKALSSDTHKDNTWYFPSLSSLLDTDKWDTSLLNPFKIYERLFKGKKKATGQPDIQHAGQHNGQHEDKFQTDKHIGDITIEISGTIADNGQTKNIRKIKKVVNSEKESGRKHRHMKEKPRNKGANLKRGAKIENLIDLPYNPPLNKEENIHNKKRDHPRVVMMEQTKDPGVHTVLKNEPRGIGSNAKPASNQKGFIQRDEAQTKQQIIPVDESDMDEEFIPSNTLRTDLNYYILPKTFVDWNAETELSRPLMINKSPKEYRTGLEWAIDTGMQFLAGTHEKDKVDERKSEQALEGGEASDSSNTDEIPKHGYRNFKKKTPGVGEKQSTNTLNEIKPGGKSVLKEDEKIKQNEETPNTHTDEHFQGDKESETESTPNENKAEKDQRVTLRVVTESRPASALENVARSEKENQHVGDSKTNGDNKPELMKLNAGVDRQDSKDGLQGEQPNIKDSARNIFNAVGKQENNPPNEESGTNNNTERAIPKVATEENQVKEKIIKRSLHVDDKKPSENMVNPKDSLIGHQSDADTISPKSSTSEIKEEPKQINPADSVKNNDAIVDASILNSVNNYKDISGGSILKNDNLEDDVQIRNDNDNSGDSDDEYTVERLQFRRRKRNAVAKVIEQMENAEKFDKTGTENRDVIRFKKKTKKRHNINANMGQNSIESIKQAQKLKNDDNAIANSIDSAHEKTNRKRRGITPKPIKKTTSATVKKIIAGGLMDDASALIIIKQFNNSKDKKKKVVTSRPESTKSKSKSSHVGSGKSSRHVPHDHHEPSKSKGAVGAVAGVHHGKKDNTENGPKIERMTPHSLLTKRPENLRPAIHRKESKHIHRHTAAVLCFLSIGFVLIVFLVLAVTSNRNGERVGRTDSSTALYVRYPMY